jgi:VWFA-related protein
MTAHPIETSFAHPASGRLRRRLAVACGLLAALLAGLLPAAAATAQAGEDDDLGQELFFDSLSVQVVNVDVFVTDKQGKPVTGLGQDDFEIIEDGLPMKVTNFYAIDANRPPAGGDSGRLADLPTGSGPALEALPEVPPEQQLSLIVYIDNLFISPFSRNNLIREVNRFLSLHMKRDDRAMLVTFDRTLNIRQPFTRDVRLVNRAMDETMRVRSFGEQAEQERTDLLKRLDSARSVNEAMGHADFYAKSMHHDVETSLNGLTELVESLGGLPGRKAILFVSEGIPMTAGEDVFSYIDTKFGEASSSQLVAHRYRVRRQFRSIVSKANANRVTFYTIDASGAYTSTSLSAEHGGIGHSFVEADFVYDSNRQEPLLMLAQGTGGQATIGTSNFGDALERIAGDLNTYYSLGYQPTHIDDGRYHTIEVKTKRSGLRVRHREGYRAKTLETRLNDGTVAALLYQASSNPLDVRVTVGAGEVNKDGLYLVPVEVRIPLSRIALLPQGTERHGRLRVSVSVMDGDGDTSPPAQTPFPIAVPAGDLESTEGRYYTYSAQLLMRRGQQQLAVGVSDEIGGDTSFLYQPVRIGG